MAKNDSPRAGTGPVVIPDAKPSAGNPAGNASGKPSAGNPGGTSGTGNPSGGTSAGKAAQAGTSPEAKAAGSEAAGALGRLGNVVNPAGDAPKVLQKPEAKRRGRPPGSKNRPKDGSAAATTTTHTGVVVGMPRDKAEKAAIAVTHMYAMPFKLFGGLKNRPDIVPSEKELAEVRMAFADYMEVRGDILGEYGPEIMLATALGIPAFGAYVRYKDPDAAKQMKLAFEQAEKDAA